MMPYNEWTATGEDLKTRPDMAETTADYMARAHIRPRTTPKPPRAVFLCISAGFVLAVVSFIALVGVAFADGLARHDAAVTFPHIEGFK